jgi:hypothetical protein
MGGRWTMREAGWPRHPRLAVSAAQSAWLPAGPSPRPTCGPAMLHGCNHRRSYLVPYVDLVPVVDLVSVVEPSDVVYSGVSMLDVPP